MAAEMSLERRSFLVGASGSVAIAASAWATSDGAGTRPQQASAVDSTLVEHHDFAALAGEWFRVRCASGAVFAMQLERVEIQRLSSQDGRRAATQAAFPLRHTPFALVFNAACRLAPGDSLVRLAHPRLGELDLFLQPLPPVTATSGVRMVAVFG